MLFAHDTETALVAAAALVNTATDGDCAADRRRPGRVRRPLRLDRLAHRDHAELEAVRALRPRLRGIWTAETDDVVAGVNALLAEAQALPQLVRHGEWDWHLHATPPEAPLATRMAVEAAMALVDVVRGGETARLGVCEAEDCDDVVVDLSKNRSRRFCEGGCGNRANVAAYRARRARGA